MPEKCETTKSLTVVRRYASAATSLPATLVLLHGYGAYEEYMLSFARYLDPRLQITAARAPVRIGPGAYCWFDYAVNADGIVTIDACEERRAFGALIELLEQERTETGTVFLLGHSQGGMMALSVLLARPDLIAGCAVLGARLLNETSCRAAPDERIRQVPVYVGHGRDDTRVPIAKAWATRRRLAAIGCPLDGRDHDTGHDVAPDMMADACRWVGARFAEVAVESGER